MSDGIDKVNVLDQMERAARFFRLGRIGEGGVSIQVWFEHPERGDDGRILHLINAMERGDYLCVADVLDVMRISRLDTPAPAAP